MSGPLVDVVWSGPFHSDAGAIGSVIQVTREQAQTNPDWYRPVAKHKTDEKTDDGKAGS